MTGDLSIMSVIYGAESTVGRGLAPSLINAHREDCKNIEQTVNEPTTSFPPHYYTDSKKKRNSSKRQKKRKLLK